MSLKTKLQLFKFELWQGGIRVAAVESTRRHEAEREINHYAMMYAADGPWEIKETTRTRKP